MDKLCENMNQNPTSRIKHLEIINQSLIKRIDVLKNLSDSFSVANCDRGIEHIFSEARIRLTSFIPFRTVGFMVVQKPDYEFVLINCEPKSCTQALQGEIYSQIDAGTFSWVIQQARSINVQTVDGAQTIIFSPLVWDGRTIGMFVGLAGSSEIKIANASLDILSIMCAMTAAAIRKFVSSNNPTVQIKKSS